LIVEVITDNKNRSFADLRTLFSKNNGNLGGSGSVSHMFDRKGEIKLSEESSDEEEVMLLAIEAGAEDVVNDDELYYVITANDKLSMVANAISASGAQIESQKIIYVPKTTESVRDLSTARQVLRLFAALDDYDDTQNVYGNFDITEHLMEKIEI